jgi:hypothetical protein
MVKSLTLKFQSFPLRPGFYLLVLLCLLCQNLWASQDAMVLSDKAVIYSDPEMTSPIGFVSRGKKLIIGEISRNKAQVYPIIVSGKIAYIKVIDVSTEKESMDSNRLTAERFQKATRQIPESKFVASYYSFASHITLSKQNGEAKDQDSFFWNGASLKGEILAGKRLDIQIISNYMQSAVDDETFRVIELGLGGALRLIDLRRFMARIEAQILAVPFSNYELGHEFRIKSFGYSTGATLNLTFLFKNNWGLEVFGGPYYTRLLAFDVPEPYADFSASFIGVRGGLGLNYTY